MMRLTFWKGTKMKIELGSEVKCRVTGFTGVAIGRTEWINGCARVVVQPKVDKDGKVPEPQNIDEPQLEVTGKIDYNTQTTTGGPLDLPSRKEVSR